MSKGQQTGRCTSLGSHTSAHRRWCSEGRPSRCRWRFWSLDGVGHFCPQCISRGVRRTVCHPFGSLNSDHVDLGAVWHKKKKKSTQPFTSDGDSMGPHKQFRVSQIPHGNDSWKKKSVLFRVLRTSEFRQCGFWGGLAQKDQRNTLRMMEMLVQLISGPIWGLQNTPWGQLLEKNSMLFCMLGTSEVKRRGFWGGLAQKDQHNPATVMEMLAQLVPT